MLDFRKFSNYAVILQNSVILEIPALNIVVKLIEFCITLKTILFSRKNDCVLKVESSLAKLQ